MRYRPAVRYLRRLLLVPMLALIAAATMGAQCHPPGSRVIIFMQGVYTVLDDNGTMDVAWEDHAFDKIKGSFVKAGYNDAQLLDFSYNGGTVSPAGDWIPKNYACTDTDRPSDQNLVPLETMMRDYRAKHPDAHFTLVGHSLGGYLAFLEGERESRRAAADRLGIDTIVALEAPLRGVAADKKIALDVAIGCPTSYTAVSELVVDKANPDIEAVRMAQVDAMRAAGMRVATLGNNNDCLYDLPACSTGTFSSINDAPTQYIENADLVKKYTIQSQPFLSHFVFPQLLIDLPLFVGAP